MKEELLSRMIRLYNMEHPIVIEFAELMDVLPQELLLVLVESHEMAFELGLLNMEEE